MIAPVAKLLALLSLAAVLSLAPPADAASPVPGGGFGISPARRYVVGSPGQALSPTLVTNGTSSTYKVTVFPVILTQNLTGAFDFANTPGDLSDARQVLSATPGSFTLPPGSGHPVDLRWNLLPANQPWVALGIVFQGIAEAQSGPVHVITRLLSVNFLSRPGLNRVTGVFTGLYPEQFAPKVLRFLARVKNTGNVFGAPSDGAFKIRDSAGQVVFSEPWTGSVVLPGAQVDFPLTVKKVLPAGHYTATVSMRFGAVSSRSTAFTLAGPNQLPTPAITIRRLTATGAVGSAARVTAQILSSGSAPASVSPHIYLEPPSALVPGQDVLGSAVASYRGLAPGSVTDLSRSLGGRLHKGDYRVFLAWTDPAGMPHVQQVDFLASTPRSALQKIWSWIKDHIVLVLGLLLLVLLLVLAYLWRKVRSRQRRVEADLEAARAELLQREAVAAPPAPAPAPASPEPAAPAPGPPAPMAAAPASVGASVWAPPEFAAPPAAPAAPPPAVEAPPAAPVAPPRIEPAPIAPAARERARPKTARNATLTVAALGLVAAIGRRLRR